ncbi:MAG: saccharopine dehydrogenase, partial [Hellea sp.]
MFVGNFQGGETLIVSVKGDRDPGSGSTSKMIAESALCLAMEVSREKTPGGIYTPAPAMGAALIERLISKAGLTFTIESA